MLKMSAVSVFSVLVLISSLVASYDEQSTDVPPLGSVTVNIYYEALCPDSQKFFNEQFHPNVRLMVDNVVNIVLIPYGKEKHEWDPQTNSWTSECRHSVSECEGHMVQACALEQLGATLTTYEYISCLMKRGQKYKPYPGKECADYLQKSSLHVDYPAIEECAGSEDVHQKIENLKRTTLALQPPLKSVPVIVFNHVYKKEDQDLALKNFKAVLCKYMTANSQDVSVCSSTSSAEGHIVTLTLLLAALTTIFIAHS